MAGSVAIMDEGERVGPQCRAWNDLEYNAYIEEMRVEQYPMLKGLRTMIVPDRKQTDMS